MRGLQLVSVLALLSAWEGAARMGWADPLFVPAPSAVARAFGPIGGPALAALGDTLGKTAIAYVLSMVLGVAAGLAVGSIRLLRDVLNPFVVALYGIPKILVLPWIVLLLGYGTAPAIFYGALHGLFPVLVLVIGAVRDVRLATALEQKWTQTGDALASGAVSLDQAQVIVRCLVYRSFGQAGLRALQGGNDAL